MTIKRSVVELRNTYKRKINAIERLLDTAATQELLSEDRKEIVAMIAVELRSLFCHSSKEALIVSSQMDKTILFPHHGSISPFNELNQFLLVGCERNGNMCTFSSCIDLKGKIASVWLSYYSWINEVVIDINAKDYPPLSISDVIKIVADKEGAHVDTDVHPFVELIESANVMPLRFFLGERECEGDCSNLLYETIISIAKEVVYSYKCISSSILCSRKAYSDFILGVFVFTTGKKKAYKYTICSPTINLYNTNKYYHCAIVSSQPEAFDLVVRSHSFAVSIIRVEKLDVGSQKI